MKLCRKLSVCGAMQVAGGADATREMLLRSEGPVVAGKLGSCRAQRNISRLYLEESVALSGASSKVSDVENRSVMRMGRVGRGMEEEGRIGVADADQRSGVCVELVASTPFKRLAKKSGTPSNYY